MGSKILITGANGFIGSHLCQKLDIEKIPYTKFSGDLVNFENVFNQISLNYFTTIIHLAGMSNIGDCEKQPDKAFSVNALGTFNLIESIHRTHKKTKFIFASTAQVYNFSQINESLAIDETFPTKPKTVYAQTKLIAEQIITNHFSRLETDGTGIILRLFNHTDGSQTGPFFFPQLISQITDAKGNNPEVKTGNLEIYRDFSLIDDLNNLLIKIIHSEIENSVDVFNVCSGNSLLLSEIAHDLAKTMKANVRFVTDPSLLRKGEPISINASNKKASTAFDWHPMKLSSEKFVEKFLAGRNKN